MNESNLLSKNVEMHLSFGTLIKTEIVVHFNVEAPKTWERGNEVKADNLRQFPSR